MTFSSTLFRIYFTIDSPALDIDEMTDPHGMKSFRLKYGHYETSAYDFSTLLSKSDFLSEEQKQKISKEYGS